MIKAAYLNELEKLLCRKKYTVFLILDALCCLFTAVVQLLTEVFSKGVIDASSLFEGMLLQGFSFYLMLFIPLIALMACADLFSGECQDLSIRMVLLRPAARWKIFLSKCLAVYSVCVFYVAAHFIIVFLVKLLMGQTTAGTAYALGAYLFDLIPVMVIVCFFAFIHQTVRSEGAAVALSVVAYGVILIMGKYVNLANGLVFTEFLTWHGLWLGVTVPIKVLLPKIGILFGTGVALYCGGYELFERKDI